MMYSDKYNYVYIAPSKTGSNSIKKFLKDNYDGQILLPEHGSIVPDKFKYYFKFMLVRNIYEW